MDAYMQPKRAPSGGFDKRFELDDAAVTQTLIEAFTNKPAEMPRYHSIHVQRLTVIVKTGADGKTWQLRFVAPGADPITMALDMSVAGAVYSFDFGPVGAAGTAGRDLEVVISAAGAAGDIYVEGYQEMLHDII